MDIIMRVKGEESNERAQEARKQWETRFKGLDMSDEEGLKMAESKCAKLIARKFGRFNNNEVR